MKSRQQRERAFRSRFRSRLRFCSPRLGRTLCGPQFPVGKRRQSRWSPLQADIAQPAAPRPALARSRFCLHAQQLCPCFVSAARPTKEAPGSAARSTAEASSSPRSWPLQHEQRRWAGASWQEPQKQQRVILTGGRKGRPCCGSSQPAQLFHWPGLLLALTINRVSMLISPGQGRQLWWQTTRRWRSPAPS